jgi:cell division protein FtsW (lipid II flippase)
MALLPVIGNPLPFLSVGGSSSLSNYLGIGIALSVHAYGRKKKKTDEYMPVYHV